MAAVSRVSSDHIATLDDFKRVLRESTVKAECGREFIRVEKLMGWLKSVVDGDTRPQIDLLARAAYRYTLVNEIRPAIHESLLLNECPLTFCILVEFDHGHLVHEFQRHHLNDINLATMDSSTLRRKIEKDMNIHDDYSKLQPYKVAQRFDELRWKYLAPKFELRLEENFCKERILPIVHKQAITNGGTAKLQRIEIHEEFVGNSLREEVSDSVKEGKDGIDRRYVFALKTFDKRNQARFENELRAFNGLRGHKGMVKYLANYYLDEFDVVNAEGQEQERTTTYNILLQYGECDLTEYFIQNYPPLFPDDILEFWQDLFEVAETVKGIHTIKEPHETYLGWHADIKPDNILLVQGKFKLADPGFMKFVINQPGNSREDVKEVIEGGTRTYGAPEMHTRANFPVSQTIDTWSLGCVFSIAATWFVTGLRGVVWFTNIRSDAVKRLGVGPGAASKEQGDQFHDGEKVLDVVKDWHNFLRTLIRNSDHITSQVLDIVDKHMLVRVPDDRDKAEAFCNRLQALLKRAAKAEPHTRISEKVMDSFKAANSQAPFVRVPIEALVEKLREKHQRPTGSEERKHWKSGVFDLVTSMTARPSLATKRPLLEQPEDKHRLENGDSVIEAVANLNGGSDLADNARTKPTKLSEHSNRPSSLSIVRHQQEKPPFHVRHDVFEAREALELEKSGRFTKHWKPKRADEYLSNYYKERDIIFLVDNARSMKRWWAQAKFLLGTLILMMSRQSDVGMQLLFTSGNASMSKMKREEDIKKLMSSDDARPHDHRTTNMKDSLGGLFQKHIRSIKMPAFRERYLTLIILTDGLWEGMQTKVGVKAKIAKFVKEVSEHQGQHQERPVGIQFIQFGKDMDAMFFLQHLDDRLALEESIPDVIDYEPSDGDVYKMLLGSFVENIDLIRPEEAVVRSPPSPGNQNMSLGN